MEKIIKIVLVVIVLIAFSVFLVNLGSSLEVEEGQKTDETGEEQGAISLGMEIEMKLAFMEGCLIDGSFAFCDCAFEHMVSKVGYEKLADLAVDFNSSGEIDDVFIEAAIVCLHLAE